jgi:hypothetical protein
MLKLLPLLALIVTASISVGRPAVAGSRFAGALLSPFATDVAGPDAAVVLVAGKGGGTGGGATTGGMGGGATTGGMGGGTTTGGMGGGTTTGSMGGGMTGGLPGSNAQLSYFTYQCATPAGACSFVAPASLRSSSLRAGARCSCSDGLSQGQIK